MKISYNLLKTLIDFNWTTDELAERLTMSGSEVEGIEQKGRDIKGVIFAKVVSVEKITGSDKLSLCKVFDGTTNLQVVCGAPNVASGMIALLAPVGSTLPGIGKMAKATIHGHKSDGMLLSEKELGFSDYGDGIAELPASVKPGTPLQDIVNYNDTVYELEITPNRPDCLSHIGIAREIQALGGGRIKMPDCRLAEAKSDVSLSLKIAIDSPQDCPRYTGRVVRNIKVNESPLWLKIMVYYLGMRPINNVVDISNFVMMELGHPLHAFDYDLFSKPEVIVRKAVVGEEFITLDNVKRKLNANHLLITDGAEGVAIAGIMGGLKSEVSEKTANILLESAYFNPITIRRGSKALSLATESSRRFERGADPNMAPIANDRACKLIQDLAGGEILRGMVDAHPKPFVPVEITLRPTQVEHLLGAPINIKEITTILNGLDVKTSVNGNIKAIQPSFRPDLLREVDLIEEIARVRGFESIPPAFCPGGTLGTAESKFHRIREKVRAFMVGYGANEIFPITLVDSKMVAKFDLLENSVRLINPLSEEMAVARPNLIVSMLPIIKRNLNFKEKNLFLFDIGDIFHPVEKGKLPAQHASMAIGITGIERPDFWGGQARKRDIYSLKAVLEDLIDHLQAGQINLQPTPYFAFEKGQSFKVYCNGIEIGYLGKLSADGNSIADIKEDVFLAEVNFEDIVKNTPDSIVAKELARFPSADRDIAIIVDDKVKAEDIRRDIIKTGGDIVETAWIFDLYRGKNIPSGKKSLAFGIKYRLPDRTLTDDEVDQAHKSIINALEAKFGAQLRS